MNDKIFKTVELDNDQLLEIYDESRKIAEDAYVVIMAARMKIKIKKELFAAHKISDLKLADILDILGYQISYEYKSERNMIIANEKDQVFKFLVETFLTNLGAYISKPIFPEKLILKEYRERVEKKNRYK